MTNDGSPLKTYRVRLGHVEVRVRAHDEQDAIARARRHLSQDMPRFYDVINGLPPTQFQVKDAA